MRYTIPRHDYSRTIATVMKDEAPYMLDWIAYHLAIGFTHFVILTNDCTDNTEKIARKLAKIGLITHKNNPSPHPLGPQKTGYKRMQNLDAIQKAGWLMTLDVDEYLRIHVGDGTLDALFAIFPHPVNAISFVWQLFGNNHVEEIIDEPIYNQFSHSQIPLQARPYETMSIKTLYQNRYFERMGTHRPIGLNTALEPEFLWISADGVPMYPYYRRRHWRSYENGLGFGTYLGRINHYALRSLDGFLVKWQRGFVHPNAPTVRGKGSILDYWKLFNWNNYLEPHTLKQSTEAQAIKSQLLAVENNEKLISQSLEIHREKAQELKRANPQIYETLIKMGSSKIDEAMPDFSHFGSPKSLDLKEINAEALLHNAQLHGILPFDDVLKYYRGNS